MIIKVTQKNIEEGKKCSRGWCPIAQAMRDKFGKDCDPRVDWHHIALGASTYYETPATAVQFIEDFDNGRSVEPFEFELKPKKNWYG